MSRIDELADRISTLTFIMDFHEKLGTVKNPLIVRAFQRAHDEYISELQKEEKDLEARKSNSR